MSGNQKSRLQEEVNEATVQYIGVVLDPLKPRISCHYTPLPKSYSMVDKPKAQIEIRSALDYLSVGNGQISYMTA